jgi:mRNA interferase MazF
MTNSPKNGDVVMANLGFVAKVRPCVVLAHQPDSQRNLAIVAPLTTEIRGGEAEIGFPKPAWLQQTCVLNLAGLLGIEHARIERRLGPFPPDKFQKAKQVLAKILELEKPPA